MKLDAYKELAAVIYGENSVKVLKNRKFPVNSHCFGPHWHNRIELIYVTNGSLNVRIRGEDFNINSGEIVIICPCLLHSGTSGNNGAIYDVIMFEPESFLNATAASSKYLQPIANGNTVFHPVSSDPELTSNIRLVLTLLKSKNVNPLSVQSLIYNIIGIFYTKCSPRTVHQTSADEKFHSITEYINNNFTQPLSTGSLSRKFGYDEAYFCRKFKKVTGITATKYINILRLEKAEKLLKETDYEINLVASSVGFSDVCYFSHAFRSHLGMTPTKFREIHRK